MDISRHIINLYRPTSLATFNVLELQARWSSVMFTNALEQPGDECLTDMAPS